MSYYFISGSPPFKPTDISGLVLWLPTFAFSIAAGTITGLDQSGHHNDCSEAATSVTIQPASGGLPPYLDYPGAGNQTILGSLSLIGPISFSLFQLRRIPAPGASSCGLFLTNATNNLSVIHDNGGGGGELFFVQGGSFVFSTGDSSVTDQVDSVISDFSVTTARIYRNGVLTTSGAVGTSGNMSSYTIGGADQFTGNSQARRIYETILYNRVLTPTEQAKVEKYLKDQAGIP